MSALDADPGTVKQESDDDRYNLEIANVVRNIKNSREKRETWCPIALNSPPTVVKRISGELARKYDAVLYRPPNSDDKVPVPKEGSEDAWFMYVRLLK